MGLYERLKRVFRSSAGAVREAAEEVADEVKDAAEDIAEKSKPYVERAKHTFEDVTEKAEDLIDEAAEKATPYVRKARDRFDETFRKKSEADAGGPPAEASPDGVAEPPDTASTEERPPESA